MNPNPEPGLRPLSQIETPSVREPPPASKSELAFEDGLRKWRSLKRLRAEYEATNGDLCQTGGEIVKRAGEADRGTAKKVSGTDLVKVDYKAKLEKYNTLLRSNKDHRRLMAELRQIEDQTVARTAEGGEGSDGEDDHNPKS